MYSLPSTTSLMGAVFAHVSGVKGDTALAIIRVSGLLPAQRDSVVLCCEVQRSMPSLSASNRAGLARTHMGTPVPTAGIVNRPPPPAWDSWELLIPDSLSSVFPFSAAGKGTRFVRFRVNFGVKRGSKMTETS